MIDRKLISVITILVKAREINIARIQRETGFTKRQIEYILLKIDEILLEKGIDSLNIENSMIFLTDEQTQLLRGVPYNDQYLSNYIMDNQERENMIFLMLISKKEEYISLNDFIYHLKVAKTTVMSDLKSLGAYLSENNLELKYTRQTGYMISGDERTIRRVVIHHIMEGLSTSEGSIYIHIYIKKFLKIDTVLTIAKLKQFISRISQEQKIVFFGNRLDELAYFLVVLKNRMNHQLLSNYTVSSEATIASTDEYKVAESILNYLSIQDTNEVSYLASWILGQSVGDIDSYSADKIMILELVERIIFRFETLVGIQFDDRKQVLQQLYGHLRPTYYRLLFKFPIVNHLVDKTMNIYKDIFYLVKETFSVFEAVFDDKIPNEEIALLTFHLASILEKQENATYIKRYRGIVVCPNGIGSSAIVYTELKNILSDMLIIGPVDLESLSQYNVESYDMIFSTVNRQELFSLNKPVFIVNPIMTTNEKYDMIKSVYAEIGHTSFRLPSISKMEEIIQKYAVIEDRESLRSELVKYLSNKQVSMNTQKSIRLSDLIKEEYVQLDVSAASWEEVLSIAVRPLIETGVIEKRYYDTILKNSQKNGDYHMIIPGISMPHAKPIHGSNGLSMSFVKLKEPIKIESSSEPMKYMFVLSSIDNRLHVSAMTDFLNLISDYKKFDEQVELLDSAEKFKQFVKENETDN